MEFNFLSPAREFALNMIRSCTLSIDKGVKYFQFTEDTRLSDLLSDNIDRIELSLKLEELNNNKNFFSPKEIHEWIYISDVVDSYSNLFISRIN